MTPSRGFLGAVMAAIVALPITAMAGGGEIGGYRMFTRLASVHLTLEAERDGIVEPIAIEAIAPHLGSDARRVVTAAVRGSALGDTAEGALSAALPRLAALGCALDPTRTRSTARLTVLDGPRARAEEATHACP